MAASLRLCLHGAFRAETAEAGMAGRLAIRSQAVLACLALSPGRRLPRGVLATLIWGDKPEEQARASLRQELSLLRRQLPDGVIGADRTAVWLDPDLVALCPDAGGARLLDGFPALSESFEDWLRQARAGDAEARLEAAMAEAGAALRERQAEAAAESARKALALDPCSEPAIRLLMQAEAALGNRAAALSAFARFAETLRQELDTSPAAETLALAQSLRGEAPPVPAGRRPCLAVLPFKELSPPGEDRFADGVVEEITYALSRVDEFDIIARQSVYALDVARLDAPGIAARFGADYLVDGSIRRAGGRVRITVQLLRGSDGRQLWSGSFDEKIDDLFALQDRIAAQVAGALSPSLRSAEISRARSQVPADRSAYELMLSAYPHFWSLKKDELRRAIGLLDMALARDPDYAPAIALKAWSVAHYASAMWTEDPARDRAEVLALCDRAAGIAGDHAPTLTALGAATTLASPDLDHANAFLDRALAIDPSNAWAWMRRGWSHSFGHEAEPALACFERAERLSPLDPFRHAMIFGRASVLYRLGDEPARAIPLIREGLRIFPGVTWAWRELVVAHIKAGDRAAAAEAVQRLLQHHPHVTVAYLKQVLPPATVVSGEPYYELCHEAGIPLR